MWGCIKPLTGEVMVDVVTLYHMKKMERFQNTRMQPNKWPWLSKLANGSIFGHPRTIENGGQCTTPHPHSLTRTHRHVGEPACTYATHKPFYSVPVVQSAACNEIVKTNSTVNCFESSLYWKHTRLVDSYHVELWVHFTEALCNWTLLRMFSSCATNVLLDHTRWEFASAALSQPARVCHVTSSPRISSSTLKC